MSTGRPIADQPRRLYRSRRGWLFGFCRGIAEYSQIHVGWVRTGFVLAALLTSFFPVALIYVVASIFVRLEPVLRPETAGDWEFYNSYASDRVLALERLRSQFENLERRTRRIESAVLSREKAWDDKFKSCS